MIDAIGVFCLALISIGGFAFVLLVLGAIATLFFPRAKREHGSDGSEGLKREEYDLQRGGMLPSDRR